LLACGSLPLEREVTSERNTLLNHDAQEAIPAADRGASLALD
jgi:hypothetical protein